MTDDIRQDRRSEAVARLDEIRREIEADPHLEVEARYRLRLQVERQRGHLLGAGAPQTVTLKSEPVPEAFLAALAAPDPAPDGLPPAELRGLPEFD